MRIEFGKEPRDGGFSQLIDIRGIDIKFLGERENVFEFAELIKN
jgi:hypothetical protein